MWFSSVFLTSKIVIFTIIMNVARSLNVTDIYVPRYAELGSTIIMRCNFTLGLMKLNSVKWYKDEVEFFRFFPDVHIPKTNIQVFPQSGLDLDISKSDKNHVALRDLSFNCTGTYKCEVSSDAPDFKTDTRNGSLTVYAYLQQDPVISGVAEKYSPGETITANCTAGPSNPAPQISWYVNKEEVGINHLRHYHSIQHRGNLSSKSVGLQFQVEESHFLSPTDVINIHCRATVGDMSVDSYMRPHRFRYPSAVESSLQRFRNSGNESSKVSIHCLIGSIILIIKTTYPL